MLYETVVIARQDISPAHVEELSEQFGKIIKSHKGKVTKTEYCGLRPLAYPIKKNRKGHYVILNIDSPANAVKELERLMRINEDVLRFLTISVEELNNGPSALFKQSRNYVDNATRGQIFKADTPVTSDTSAAQEKADRSSS